MAEVPTVLVVEDELPARELMVDVLHAAGYAVVEAADGVTAVRAFYQYDPPSAHFSVVVLDLLLPDVDGLDILLHLAMRGDTVPVVAISASHSHLEAARSRGAHCILPKPFDVDQLLAVVGEHCSR